MSLLPRSNANLVVLALIIFGANGSSWARDIVIESRDGKWHFDGQAAEVIHVLPEDKLVWRGAAFADAVLFRSEAEAKQSLVIEQAAQDDLGPREVGEQEYWGTKPGTKVDDAKVDLLVATVAASAAPDTTLWFCSGDVACSARLVIAPFSVTSVVLARQSAPESLDKAEVSALLSSVPRDASEFNAASEPTRAEWIRRLKAAAESANPAAAAELVRHTAQLQAAEQGEVSAIGGIVKELRALLGTSQTTPDQVNLSESGVGTFTIEGVLDQQGRATIPLNVSALQEEQKFLIVEIQGAKQVIVRDRAFREQQRQKILSAIRMGGGSDPGAFNEDNILQELVGSEITLKALGTQAPPEHAGVLVGYDGNFISLLSTTAKIIERIARKDYGVDLEKLQQAIIESKGTLTGWQEPNERSVVVNGDPNARFTLTYRQAVPAWRMQYTITAPAAGRGCGTLAARAVIDNRSALPWHSVDVTLVESGQSFSVNDLALAALHETIVPLVAHEIVAELVAWYEPATLETGSPPRAGVTFSLDSACEMLERPILPGGRVSVVAAATDKHPSIWLGEKFYPSFDPRKGILAYSPAALLSASVDPGKDAGEANFVRPRVTQIVDDSLHMVNHRVREYELSNQSPATVRFVVDLIVEPHWLLEDVEDEPTGATSNDGRVTFTLHAGASTKFKVIHKPDKEIERRQTRELSDIVNRTPSDVRDLLEPVNQDVLLRFRNIKKLLGEIAASRQSEQQLKALQTRLEKTLLAFPMRDSVAGNASARAAMQNRLNRLRSDLLQIEASQALLQGALVQSVYADPSPEVAVTPSPARPVSSDGSPEDTALGAIFVSPPPVGSPPPGRPTAR